MGDDLPCRVLVVDDEAPVAVMWAASLERAGFSAVAVFDPSEHLTVEQRRKLAEEILQRDATD